MSSQAQPTAIVEVSIPEGTPLSSHDEYQIGGLPVHIYGIKEATDLADTSNELVVLHLIHPRTRSYHYTQQMAHIILAQYYKEATLADHSKKSLPPCVAATFDLRNHGHRIVTKDNTDWKRGNTAHGQDMVTGILGSAQDVELVLEFLPAYLPQILTNSSNGQPKKIWNIVSGVSQGGHITWKVAAHSAKNPQFNILAAIPLIGAPDLTTLLIHRLLIQIGGLSRDAAREFLETKVFAHNSQENSSSLNRPFKSAAYFSWSELATALEYTDKETGLGLKDVKNTIFPKYWPQTLHELITREDRATLENVKAVVPNVFIINSKADPLVPSWVSHQFATKFPSTGRPQNESPADKTLYEKEGIGHVVTNDMVDLLTAYIINVVKSRK